MARSACRLLLSCARGALVTGLLAAGCGSSPPVDQNFGTNLGADFVAPVTDAGSDGETGGTDGASTAGTGGTTTTGGTGGTTATGGTSGSSMDASADGNAGQ